MKWNIDTAMRTGRRQIARVFFVLFFLLMASNVLAQIFTIRGKVYGSDKMGLPGATIMLMTFDSLTVASTITDIEGNWQLDSIKRAQYILKISYVGFLNHVRRIKPGKDNLIDIGQVILRPRVIELDEVTVTHQREPVIINGDTIQYNADSYSTQRHSKLNELLKKLPGFQIDPNGVITVNGEILSKIYIDGKETTGQSLTMFLENLPAEAVKSVKVFDSNSSDQSITGSDGFQTSALGLEIKDEFRNMTFGSASGGIGDRERYTGELNLNTFKPKNQFSILGKSNNINDLQVDGALPGDITQLQTPGITKTHAGTVSLLTTISPKLTLSTTYSANLNDKRIASQTARTDFFPNDVISVVEQDQQKSASNSQTAGIVLNLNDSTNTLRVNVTGSLIAAGADGYLERGLASSFDPTLSYQNQAQYKTDLDNASGNGNLYYHHNFNKKGRRFIIVTQGSRFYNTLQNENNNIVQDYDGETTFVISNSQRSNTESYAAKASYKEPISRRQSIVAQYSYSKRLTETSALNNGSLTESDNQLSNEIRSYFSVQQAGLQYQFNDKKISIQIGGNIQRAEFSRKTVWDDVELSQTFENILPYASLNFRLSNYTKLKLQYRTFVREPSPRELQPVQPINDPFTLFVPNLSLTPEYFHEAKVSINKTSKKKRGLYFSANSGARFSDNALTMTSRIDSNLVRTIEYVNASENLNLSATLQAGIPIKKLNSAFKVSTFSQWNSYYTFLNETNDRISQLTTGFDALYTYTYKKIFELNIGAVYNTTALVEFPMEASGQDLTASYYKAELIFNFLSRLRFTSGINYTTVTNEALGTYEQTPIVNASLTLELFKKRNGQLRLSGINILNEGTNASLSASINSIERMNYTNAIGSFYLLSFTYHFQKQAQN